MENPKLRPIQAVGVRDGGRVLVQLFDPAQISDKMLVVHQDAMVLLSLFDGTRSMTDIQAALIRRTGQFVLSADIQRVIDQLDEALLLDSERFRDHMRQLEEAFRRSPVRRSASAGKAYPAAPSELRAQLDGYFAAEGLTIDGRAAAQDRLVGVVAPHIDFERGGPTYAHAYAALAAGAPDAELFVVFGTAHYPQDSLFILTRKAFETPLGMMATDAELVDELARRAGGEPFREEFVHASEHSVEFQVVFLQRLLGGRPAQMLPILCSSFEERLGDDQSPRDLGEWAAFVDALREVVAASGKRACAVAGADLSHVGRHFGDDFALTPQVMADVERADRENLAHVERLDAVGFYDAVRADGNARHICGVPPICALLATTDATRCDLLAYRQATDYPLQRAVTFAALALYA